MARPVDCRPQLGARRAVRVDALGPTGPLVEPVTFGVGETVRFVRAALHEPEGHVLDEPETSAYLIGTPLSEPEFVGWNADVLAGIEDDPVVVPRFERADVRLAGRSVRRDCSPFLFEKIPRDGGVLTGYRHRREAVVSEPDGELDTQVVQIVSDQRFE